MKLIGKMITIAGVAAAISSCGSTETTTDNAAENKEFKYLVDEFADLKIMRYQVPGLGQHLRRPDAPQLGR